jgi:hypothetical protein
MNLFIRLFGRDLFSVSVFRDPEPEVVYTTNETGFEDMAAALFEMSDECPLDPETREAL